MPSLIVRGVTAPAAAMTAAGRTDNATGSSGQYAGPAARVQGSPRGGDGDGAELGRGVAGGRTLGPTAAEAAADGGEGARGGVHTSTALAGPAKPPAGMGWRGGVPPGPTPGGGPVLSGGGGGLQGGSGKALLDCGDVEPPPGPGRVGRFPRGACQAGL